MRVSPHNYAPSPKALSLIEMITVMAIISLLTVMTVPSLYSLLTTYGLSTGIRDVSNQLVFARSEAIAKHTLTRFLIATSWAEEDGAYRKFSTWSWDAETSKFYRISKWGTLPKGVVFEPTLPGYILKSDYAKNDATTVHGEYALSQEDATVEIMAFEGKPAQVQFVEFLPTGSARIPGGVLKTVIFVMTEGIIQEGTSGPVIIHQGVGGTEARNWAQVNLGTLTGRVRIFRP